MSVNMIRRSFLGFAVTAIVVAAAACSASAAGAAFASRPSIDSSPATVAASAAPPARSVSGPAVRVAQDSAPSMARLADSLNVDTRADARADPRADPRADAAPARHDRSHRSGDFGGIGFLGAALAQKKVKNSRKKTGRSLSIPQILDSHVHVARENAEGKAITVQHDAGTLVDDTDLSDDEISELTARRAIRNATQEDLDHIATTEGTSGDAPGSASTGDTAGAGGAQIENDE